MRKLPMMIIAVALLAGCTNAPQTAQDAQGVARLQAMLAGKTAEAKITCIPSVYSGNAPSVVTNNNVAFYVNPSLVYVSDVEGSGCSDAADPSNIVITKSSSALGLCSGDEMRIIDQQTKVIKGACVLSNFTPYRRAG